jgi:protein SCO1/2
MRYLHLFFFIALFYSTFSQNNPLQTDVKQEIGISEHLDEYIPNDIVFHNFDSVEVNLKQMIDKPTVISFVYYTCPGLCTPLLNGLAEVIDRSDLILGDDYQVITISIEPEDLIEVGKGKKRNLIASMENPINEEAWIWIKGDQENITKATKTLGFDYLKDGKDYIHAAAIMVVSPKGKITRYLHGTYFLPFDLKMAISEAKEEKSGPTISKVLKFCFSYDAEGKKYVFNITKVTGIIILSAAFIFLLVLILKKPKKNKQIK